MDLFTKRMREGHLVTLHITYISKAHKNADKEGVDIGQWPREDVFRLDQSSSSVLADSLSDTRLRYPLHLLPLEPQPTWGSVCHFTYLPVKPLAANIFHTKCPENPRHPSSTMKDHVLQPWSLHCLTRSECMLFFQQLPHMPPLIAQWVRLIKCISALLTLPICLNGGLSG